jgi:hypothetical protein
MASLSARFRLAPRVVAVVGAGLVLVACNSQREVRIIEFGWDIPDTSFMRRHVRQMAQTPFDGCVFNLIAVGEDGRRTNVGWAFWGRRRFAWGEVRHATQDLRLARSGRFQHHFLRINVTPGLVDWYDDASAIVANARLVARVAHEGKCAGLLLDTEQYEGAVFSYRQQRHAPRRSWEEYARQVRMRGQEIMHAFEQGYPGLTVLLTFGASVPWWQSHVDQHRPLAECSYGLLAPFTEGLVAGAHGGRIVDGYELSYGFRDPGRFRNARDEVLHGAFTLLGVDPLRRQKMTLGFGLWLDFERPRYPWSETHLESNYFTPRAFERSLRAAIEHSDGYVWVYSETPRWWTPEGGPAKLPSAYADAIRRARAEALPNR